MNEKIKHTRKDRDMDKSYRAYLQHLLSFPHDPIELITTVHKRRHYIVRTRSNQVYWCLVKWGGPFFKFGDFFLKRSEQGESINETELLKALKLEALLVFSYPQPHPPPQNFASYSIDAKRFKKIAEEEGFMRTTHGGEKTYSVPLRELQQIKFGEVDISWHKKL